jgi:hypothetical protein
MLAALVVPLAGGFAAADDAADCKTNPQQAKCSCNKNPTLPNCPCGINPNSSACSDLKNVNNSAAASTNYNSLVHNILNVFLWAIGILALIMTVVSGVRFVTSAGNSDQTTKARRTLQYSITGLVIAIVAYAIVSMVFSLIK